MVRTKVSAEEAYYATVETTTGPMFMYRTSVAKVDERSKILADAAAIKKLAS